MRRFPLILGLLLMAALVPAAAATAHAAWVKVIPIQDVAKEQCPQGFELISVQQEGHEVLVCSPEGAKDPQGPKEGDQPPAGQEGPLEGPHFDS